MKLMPGQASEPSKTSPYSDARREWNERYGDYIAQARNWRLMAFGALGIAAIAVGGNVWQAGQSKVVPYVIETDRLGDRLVVGRVGASSSADPRVVRAMINRWVTNVRTVTTDPDAATRNVDEAYAVTDKNGSAFPALNEWYGAHDPYKRARDGNVTITITSFPILRAGHTWRVGWQEAEHPISGPAPVPKDWEAEIVVGSIPLSKDEDIDANSTGNYVNSFNWGIRQ